MSKRSFRTFACVALLATAGVACSSDDEDEGTDTTEAVDETDAPVDETDAPVEETDAPAAGGELVISGFAFPDSVTATAGGAISVVNEDTSPHTVTADDGSFNLQVGGSATESLTIDAAGSYAIHCEIHPSMTSTITVS